jgi:hypothetical protein
MAQITKNTVKSKENYPKTEKNDKKLLVIVIFL